MWRIVRKLTRTMAVVVSPPARKRSAWGHVGAATALVVAFHGALVAPADAQAGPSKGRVKSFAVDVTASTPLWAVDAKVGLKAIDCPAAVVVTVGAAPSHTSQICEAGETAPASVTVSVPVSGDLVPATTVTATADLYQIEGLVDSSARRVQLPPRPVWVALGDSFSSGHHQDDDEPYCLDPAESWWNGVINAFACSIPGAPHYVRNDPGSSWAIAAADELNFRAPTGWRFETVFVARSGAKTSELGDTAYEPGTAKWAGAAGPCGPGRSPSAEEHPGPCASQVSRMRSALADHSGSWNVVSVTGGANDADFAKALRDFYGRHNADMLPWAVPDGQRSECPDADGVLRRAQAAAATIKASLAAVAEYARKASPEVRIVDGLYPYVVDQDNVCAPTVPAATPRAGSDDVVRYLNSLHRLAIPQSVIRIDMTEVLFHNPFNLQQTRYYGYPHPGSGTAIVREAAYAAICPQCPGSS